MKRNEVFGAISSERDYQEDKWGNPKSSVAEYLIYMRHHLDKAFKSMSTGQPIESCNSVLSQIRKVSALGVACGEEHGMCYRTGDYGQVFFNGENVLFDNTEEGGLKGIFRCVCADTESATFAEIRVNNKGSYASPDNLIVLKNTADVLDVLYFQKLDEEQFKKVVTLAHANLEVQKSVIKIDGRSLI